MKWLVLAAILLVAPVSATHVDRGDISWACGFGGGHPDQCGINPVGGGEAVQEVGPAVWSEEVWIEGDAQVLGIVVDGHARAVPVRLLDAHEIVNTRVGQTDVSITYCPLCGSGITFDRTISIAGETQTVAFAASGYLFQSDLVMWDDHWGLLWNQITGRAIATLEAGVREDHPDVQLTRIPTVLTTWDAWQASHPDTLLLEAARGSYGYPYGDYETNAERCGLGRCGDTGDLHPKEFIVGVDHGSGVAFPRFGVQSEGGVAIQDGVVVSIAPDGQHQTWLTGERTFTKDASGLWVDEQGQLWDLAEGQSVAGERLEAVTGLVMFWFAWQEHHPETSLWTPAEGPAGGLKVDNGRLPGFTIPIVLGLLVLGGWLYVKRR